MQQPHLCVVTSAHPVGDVRVKSKIVDSLLEAGWRVSWVGPGDGGARTGAGGSKIDYHLLSEPRGRLGRLTSSFRLRRAAASVRAVDWWYSPDPDAARVANRLAGSRGGRSVFDIHEVFHTGHLDQWTRGRRIKWLSRLVRRSINSTCRRADLVVAVGDRVLAQYDTGDTPTVIVRNCAPVSFADASTARLVDRDEMSLSIMHGKYTPKNGSPQVLAALQQLPREVSCSVVMIVPEAAWSAVEATSSELSDGVELQMMSRMPHAYMGELTARCHIGLISYQRDVGDESLPNRLFEYMAAGLAVIAPSYSHEVKAIIESEGIGSTCDFESPAEIAAAIADLASDKVRVEEMGRRARDAFVERHSWDGEFSKLESALSLASRLRQES